MKLHYRADTDSLNVELQKRPSVETREIASDIRLDLDETGKPVGLDIDHASELLDLQTLESEGLPLGSTSGDAAPAWTTHRGDERPGR